MSSFPFARPAGLLGLVLLAAGCRSSGTSLSMNSDSPVPLLGMSFVPMQTEPVLAQSERRSGEADEADLESEEDEQPTKSRNLLTRWIPGGKSSKPKRIAIPRTDLAGQDEPVVEGSETTDAAHEEEDSDEF